MEEKFFRNKIQVYSFFSSLLVIFIHAFNLNTYGIDKSNPIVYWIEMIISQDIGLLAVPMFFVISGFLFFRTVSDYGSITVKQKKRIKTLLIPYLLWTTIYMLFFFVLTNTIFLGKIINEEKVVLNIENIVRGVLFHKYANHLWFLYQLLLITAITPIIFLCLSRRYIIYPLFIGLFVISVLNGDWGVEAGEIYFLQAESLLFYCVGAYMSMHRKKEFEGNGSIGFGVIMLVLSQIMWAVYLLNGAIYWAKLLCKIFGTIGIWYAVNPKTIFHAKEFMNYSFFTYTIHIIILEFIEKIIFILFPHSAVAAITDYIAAPFLTMIIIYGLAVILTKYLKKVWWLLNGGRGA